MCIFLIAQTGTALISGNIRAGAEAGSAGHPAAGKQAAAQAATGERICCAGGDACIPQRPARGRTPAAALRPQLQRAKVSTCAASDGFQSLSMAALASPAPVWAIAWFQADFLSSSRPPHCGR